MEQILAIFPEYDHSFLIYLICICTEGPEPLLEFHNLLFFKMSDAGQSLVERRGIDLVA